MSVIVNRLRELAEAATNKVVEEDTAKRSHKSTAERDAVKEDIYHFDVLTLEEDIVNRMMRDRLRNHWLIYSITFEFEPNNHVFMCVITKTGMVINLEFTIEDCWYDDYSASFVIKVPVGSIDMDSFIINIVMRLLGSFIFSLCNLIFTNIDIKIFLFIIFCLPLVIFSIVGFNHENILYVLLYILKFVKSQKVYLYNKSKK